MGSRGETVVKLRMTPYFWRLLGKYCIVLSCQTMARGGHRMSITQTVTGIISSHLLRHAQWIEHEFNQIIREIATQASGYPTPYVNGVASATSGQIPDVVRAGTSPKRLASILKRLRPILHSGGPARVHVGRPRKKPGEVRTGSGRASSANDLGLQDLPDLEQGGEGATEQGDPGPQPKLLQKAVRDFGKFLSPEDAKAIVQKLGRRKGKGGSATG